MRQTQFRCSFQSGARQFGYSTVRATERRSIATSGRRSGLISKTASDGASGHSPMNMRDEEPESALPPPRPSDEMDGELDDAPTPPVPSTFDFPPGGLKREPVPAAEPDLFAMFAPRAVQSNGAGSQAIGFSVSWVAVGWDWSSRQRTRSSVAGWP